MRQFWNFVAAGLVLLAPTLVSAQDGLQEQRLPLVHAVAPVPPSATRLVRQPTMAWTTVESGAAAGAMLNVPEQPVSTGAPAASAAAQGEGGGSADLAKQLANPVADLISVPFQGNVDYGIGSSDVRRYWLNIQPVIPVSISSSLNLISRTIIPLVHAEAPITSLEDATGLGDVLQSCFISPKDPQGGPVWGFGPVFLFPTATEDALGGQKWGVGPTGLVLKQIGPWTVGALANHIWSVAGDENRDDINATFLQPFVSYNFPTGLGFSLNTESTYDWEHSRWTVPLNLGVSQVTKLCGQPVSLQAGVRYYAEAPEGGPTWGLRFGVVLLFPKKG